MNLNCDLSLAANYHNASQQARVISEGWFLKNVYCLACDADELRKTPANTRATDFVCPKCSHSYELKAFKHKRPKSLPDGAFGTMMQKVRSGKAPTLCLLERTLDWQIRGLTAIHSSFLLPEAIVARNPLSQNAERSNWVGCKILLDQIDSSADVEVIENGIEQPADEVRRRFQRFLPLARKRVSQRGWTVLTLRMVRALQKNSFDLQDLYALENEFAGVYPGNRHIKDKIRQQLQILRDLGVLAFEERGEYRLLN
jgi:type II restriction enzyme